MIPDFKRLQEPFPSEDIEWRIGRAGYSGDKLYGTCLAYVTNRAIMNRLDDAVGSWQWKNEFVTGPQGGVLCGLSIKVGDEWVTKWDGAENTDIESVKGGLSDAMKRAAVQWGIGRYLYNLDEGFVVITEKGRYFAKSNKNADKPYKFRWDPPALPSWALPKKELAKELDRISSAS